MVQPSFVPFAGRTGPFVPSLPGSPSPSSTLSCHGSPEGSVPGIPGQVCVDIDTDDLYQKMLGTQMVGWVKTGTAASGVGGSTTSVQASATDPNGVLTINGPGICFGKDGNGNPDGRVWIKSSTGSGSVWQQVLG